MDVNKLKESDFKTVNPDTCCKPESRTESHTDSFRLSFRGKHDHHLGGVESDSWDYNNNRDYYGFLRPEFFME